jgi:hypothetical protein
MTALRLVTCEKGPQDGVQVYVPLKTDLPDTVSFPHFASQEKRDIYRLTHESEDKASYEFDHVEVGA